MGGSPFGKPPPRTGAGRPRTLRFQSDGAFVLGPVARLEPVAPTRPSYLAASERQPEAADCGITSRCKAQTTVVAESSCWAAGVTFTMSSRDVTRCGAGVRCGPPTFVLRIRLLDQQGRVLLRQSAVFNVREDRVL